MLPSLVEQSHFVKKIAEKAGVREDPLWETLKRLPSPKVFVEAKGNAPPSQKGEGSRILRRLVMLLFFLDSLPEGKERCALLHSRIQSILGEPRLAEATRKLNQEREALLLEAEVRYGAAPPATKEEEELLSSLEEEDISAALTTAVDALARAERSGEKENAQKLLAECKSLSERLEKLKATPFFNI